MQLQQITNLTSSQTTMSSREIAELTGKRHPDVKRDILNMFEQLEQDASSFAHTYLDSQNRQQTQFNLDKELTLTLVSGYNVELRNKIIKRWMELEAKQQQNLLVLPNFTDPVEAATAWIEQYKEKQVALQLLEVAKPKVSHYDNYVESSSLKTVTNAAKEMKLTSNVLWDWLRKEGHAFKNEKKNIWTKGFIEKGYGEMKQFTRKDNGYSGTQPYLTSTGDLFIKQNFTK